MTVPNWKAVNAELIANECSPRHIQSVIEYAQRDIAELVEALRDAANRIDDMLEGDDGQAWGEARQSAARLRALLARIDG